MKDIVVISDYIEGYPAIASVRYEELIKFMTNSYNFTVVNDIEFGSHKSKYCSDNYKYRTLAKKGASNSGNNASAKGETLQSSIKKYLKKSKILQKIKGFFMFNRSFFVLVNYKMLKNLLNQISKNEINTIFVSTPMVNTLYIANYLKQKNKKIKVVVEIRDIINNDMYRKVYPKCILVNAEKIISNVADGIIALSPGIYDYYKDMCDSIPIKLILNGFDAEKFKSRDITDISVKQQLTFTHVGSIYGGRNLGDFILALNEFSKEKGIDIKLNLVGNLDSIAENEILKCSKEITNDKFILDKVGVVPHNKAVEYLINTDYSVILTHKEGSQYAIPGKTFEAIGACKPIIAVTEDKGLKELIDGKYGICSDHNVTSIKDALYKLTNTSFDFSDRLKYSRESQAKYMERFMSEVVVLKDS